MKGKELPLYRAPIEEKEYVIVKKNDTKWVDSLPMFKDFITPAIDKIMVVHAQMSEFYYNNKAIGWFREQDKFMFGIRVGVIVCCSLGPRMLAYKKGWFTRNAYTLLGGTTGSLIVFPDETCFFWRDLVYPVAESNILTAYNSITEASKESKDKEEKKK